MALKHLITCVVAGIDYLVHPQILGSVEESVRADQIIPVLVLSEREIESGPEKLWDILQYYVNNDDVCIDDFTGILVVMPTSNPDSDHVSHHVPSPDLSRFSSVYHMKSETIVYEQERKLTSGPYFLSGPNLHQAWRLYPDDLDAFNFGLIPDDVFTPESFKAIASQSSEDTSKTIPVPSRHYHHPTPERPLSGTRLAITDTFDIEGVKTTWSSRAWAELYPAASAVGPYVKQLLEQGAVIVGKTRTTQFSAGTEWVDFHSPTNPRGDRYQDASGSSTGAAASLAGYPWLDYAVGGDIDGGIRAPASNHGLHALRPTFGSASLDGIKTNSPTYDTVGVFGRSLRDLAFMTEHSLDVPRRSEDNYFPSKIIYPTNFFPLPDVEHQKLLESFFDKLETYLGVKKVEIDLVRLWAESTHADPDARISLQKYMEKAPFWSLCYDSYHTSKQFRSDYHEKYDRDPFVEAATRLRWNIGANITRDERDLYLDRIATFKEWFDREVFSSGGHGHQDAILVLPYGHAGPTYRDTPKTEPAPSTGVHAAMLSPILGTPHLVVPFAQLPYESRVSGGTEYRPISASIMGARGSDVGLIRIVEGALHSAGWRTEVDTGRYTFPVVNNNWNLHDGENDDGWESAKTFHSNGDAVSDSSVDEL
ncbi:unnamed protein product [Discula destructiva]